MIETNYWSGLCVVLGGMVLGLAEPPSSDFFSVATYNLENYVEEGHPSRRTKLDAARAKVHESLLALRADVVALQEIGATDVLLELRDALRDEGLDYAYWEHVKGFDTNTYVAILSRFPFVTRRPHTNEGYLLYGRRFRVSRGFAEVDVRVNDHYRFTMIAAHLKSRREVAIADQEELREQEAICLRRIIDARLRLQPQANLLVVGDLNDHPSSSPIKIILARGKTRALYDTRPAERRLGQSLDLDARSTERRITWTHFYGKEDVYSRIDYILASRGIIREWDPGGTYVLASPDWGIASDHRPLVARFQALDR